MAKHESGKRLPKDWKDKFLAELAQTSNVLDQRVSVMGGDLQAQFGSGFAALGPADTEPATAVLENDGASLRPLCPVHGRIEKTDGSVRISWTRRARGGWR